LHGRAALPTSGGVEVWRCGGKCHLTAGTHWDDAAGVAVSEGHGGGAVSRDSGAQAGGGDASAGHLGAAATGASRTTKQLPPGLVQVCGAAELPLPLTISYAMARRDVLQSQQTAWSKPESVLLV
jgi:hypothetical protein